MQSIPEDIWIGLFSEWLIVTDVARLDSATCNHAERSGFLNIAYTSCPPLKYPSKRPTDDVLGIMSIWICRKNFATRGLFLSPSLLLASGDLVARYLACHGQILEWISYKQGDSDSLQAKMNETVVMIVANCPNVKKLTVVGWNGDQAVGTILTSCRQLTELRLETVSAATSFSSLVGKFNKLRKLTVLAPTSNSSSDSQLTGLISVLDGCVRLEELTASVAGNGSLLLDAIRKKCSQVRSLSLLRCLVDMPAVLALLERCTELRSLCVENLPWAFYPDTPAIIAPLHTLKLTHLSFSASYLRDHWLMAILTSCPDLQSLVLRRCGAHSSLVADVGHVCTQLERLDVSNNDTWLTDEALLSVGASFPSLRELYLTEDLLVTDVGVAAVTQGCAKLEVLHLPSFAHITDASLVALSMQCRELRVLRLANNKYVTDAGVEALLQSCRKLRDLDLCLCSMLSEGMVTRLEKLAR
jgi:hypothetical protein